MVDPMELFIEDGTTLPGYIFRMLALMKDLDLLTHNKMTDLDRLRHEVIEELYSKHHTHKDLNHTHKDLNHTHKDLNHAHKDLNHAHISLDPIHKDLDLTHASLDSTHSLSDHTHTLSDHTHTSLDYTHPNSKKHEHIQNLNQNSKSLIREKIAIANQFLHLVRHEKEKLNQYYQKLIQQTTHTDHTQECNNNQQLKRNKGVHTHTPNQTQMNVMDNQSNSNIANKTQTNNYYEIKNDFENNSISPIPNNKRHLHTHYRETSDTSSVTHFEGPVKKTKKDRHTHNPSEVRKDLNYTYLPTHTQISLKTTSEGGGSNLSSSGMRISVASTKEIHNKSHTRPHELKPSSKNDLHTKGSDISTDLTRPTWSLPNQTSELTHLNDEELWDGICPICQKGESETHHMMVGCDACNNWFHFECVNYNPIGSEDAAWFCPQCIADRLVPYNSS